MNAWLKDDRGNKCSVEYFGSKEEAQAALDSLKNCDNCVNCSRCSRCSGCSDCSHIAWLDKRENLQADPDAVAAGQIGPPPVPVIENIHQTVYAAASNPKALDMNTWHTCENTHCWAGWLGLPGPASGLSQALFKHEHRYKAMIRAALAPADRGGPHG
jgi:hypothetical protein